MHYSCCKIYPARTGLVTGNPTKGTHKSDPNWIMAVLGMD